MLNKTVSATAHSATRLAAHLRHLSSTVPTHRTGGKEMAYAPPQLEKLDDVVEVSTGCIRILGQNPGSFTLQGTNTYLLSGTTRSLLVDTGEGKPEYVEYLRHALGLAPHPVEDIVLSHWHGDHVGGLSDCIEAIGNANVRIWKWESSRDETVDEEGTTKKKTRMIKMKMRGGQQHEVRVMQAGQRFHLGDLDLEVVHAPGHTDDSICLVMTRQGQLDGILTGDTVLGQGTTVFEDLGAYLTSLRHLVSLCDDDSNSHTRTHTRTRLYPAHGPIVEDGKAVMEQYIRHRLEREAQVVKALVQCDDQTATAEEIVRRVYGEQLPTSVLPAAAHGVTLHLEKLAQEGQVSGERGGSWTWTGSGSGSV